MLCPYCGSANVADQRFCRRCAALIGRTGAVARPPAARVAPVQGASSRLLPLPCGARGNTARPAVLVDRLPCGRPVAIVAAGSTGRPQATGPSAAAAGTLGRSGGLTLPWLGAGLVVSAAVIAAAHLTLRGPAAQWWAELAPFFEGRTQETGNEVVTQPEAPPGPAPRAAEQVPDSDALAARIDGQLRRLGAQGIEVSAGAGGALTVRGLLATPQDRVALLDWLRSQPGVVDIDDQTEVVPPPAPPAPRPAARPEPAATPAPTARPAPPPPVALERPAPPPLAAPERTAPPLRDEAPARPDPGALARQVQRELGRLGLADVNVEVDPATLQITLRGRTHDGAGKAQALAYARSLVPGGRVRDIVFLVEE